MEIIIGIAIILFLFSAIYYKYDRDDYKKKYESAVRQISIGYKDKKAFTELFDNYTKLNEKYAQLQRDFTSTKKSYDSYVDKASKDYNNALDREKRANQKIAELREQCEAAIDSNYARLFDSKANPSLLSQFMSSSLTYPHIISSPDGRKSKFWQFVYDESGNNAHTISFLSVNATISTQSGESYTTSLDECTCRDFTYRLHKSSPCKHMYFLAYTLAKSNDIPFEKIVKEASATSKDLRDLERQKKNIDNEIKILKSNQQSFPYAAKIISDYHADLLLEGAEELRNKKPPAMKAADKVSSYAEQLREWCRRAKLAEHRLTFLQYIFPWLEEFDDIPPADAYRATLLVDNAESGYDHYKNWLSPEEYEKLTPAERNQRALDKYIKRPKSNWEAGIEYERYIGYLCEKYGYSVSYVGAVKGLEDMGRDLIAKKDSATYIIQCKRWAKEKTIHEKHIFQLYGTVVLYEIEHPGEVAQPVFVTTTTISETANLVAKHLGIIICSDKNMDSYPLIKCNIGKDGIKIYHMPFDLQYDTVVISPERGEFYAETVAEAEIRGFRHAYRWHS